MCAALVLLQPCRAAEDDAEVSDKTSEQPATNAPTAGSAKEVPKPAVVPMTTVRPATVPLPTRIDPRLYVPILPYADSSEMRGDSAPPQTRQPLVLPGFVSTDVPGSSPTAQSLMFRTLQKPNLGLPPPPPLQSSVVTPIMPEPVIPEVGYVPPSLTNALPPPDNRWRNRDHLLRDIERR